MKNLDYIVIRSFELLFEHRQDPDYEIYYYEESKTFSWFEAHTGETEKLNLGQAVEKFKNLVQESYNKYGKVLLYSCRDNGLISVEDSEPDSERVWESCYIKEVEGIEFYIGYD